MTAQSELFAIDDTPTPAANIEPVKVAIDLPNLTHTDPARAWGTVQIPDSPTGDVTGMLEYSLPDFDLGVFRGDTLPDGYSVAGAVAWLTRWAAYKHDAVVTAEADAARAKRGLAPRKRKAREPKLPNLGLRLLNAAIWGTPLFLEGERGIGKSAATVALCGAWGLTVGVVHLSNSTPETFAISMPSFGINDVPVIRTEVVGPLKRINLLILEEPNRAPQDVQTAAMEALSELSVAGQRMPWLSVVAIMNPTNGEYSTVDVSDPAQLDRGTRYKVTSADTGWAAHLERSYGTTDELAKRVRALIARADKMDPEFAPILNARKLEQFIQVALYNEAHPGDAVPLDIVFGEDGNGRYFQFTKDSDRVDDKNGTAQQKIAKRHAATVSALADAFKVPYTSLRDVGTDLVRRALLATLRNNWSLLWYAPHGAGKTSIVKDVLRGFAKSLAEVDVDGIDYTAAQGVSPTDLRVESISLAQMAPQSQVLPLPIDGQLEYLVDSRWITPHFVALLDEYNRATPQQHAEFMSTTHPGERTLGGYKIPAIGLVALCNPPTAGTGDQMVEYNVNPLDPAIRERFPLTIITDVADHGVDSFLLNADQYGEIASTVVSWWTETVLTRPNGSILCSGRTVERLMQNALAGLPLEEAIAPIGQGDSGINPIRTLLPDLRARLRGSVALTAEKLLGDPKWTVSQMAGSQDFQSEVASTLVNAPVKILKDHWDALVDITLVMDHSYRENFIYIDHDTEKQDLMISLLVEVRKLEQAA